MKKKIGALMVSVGLFLALGTVGVSAAPNEMAVGVGGGYASYNNGGYAKVFLQYAPISHLRLAPEVGYVIRNQNKSAFEIALDIHAPFRVGRGVGVYPLAGVTVNQWNYSESLEKEKKTRVGLDLGGGLDLYMTSNLKINFQFKYSIMRHTSGCFIDLGVAYEF